MSSPSRPPDSNGNSAGNSTNDHSSDQIPIDPLSASYPSGQPHSPQQPQPQQQQRDGTANRRPLSSVSFFFPWPRPPNEEGTEGGDGEQQAGLTWTLEVFANDDRGDDEGTTATSATPTGGDGEANNAGAGIVADNNAADSSVPSSVPLPDPVSAAPEANANAPGPPPLGPGLEEGTTMFFIVGPDGRLIRHNVRGGPEGEDGLPQLLPFLPFPFPFANMQPPAPDPAKAIELLEAMPTVGRSMLKRVNNVIAAEDVEDGKDEDDRGWRCGICLEGAEGLEAADSLGVGESSSGSGSGGLSSGPDSDNVTTKDVEMASSSPVKVLPCNHLFHEGCLHPWFTSHHTCPTCRLDLDPFRTLHPPREARQNPLRPAATGSGRNTPASNSHPYARPGASASAAASGSGTSSGTRTPAIPILNRHTATTPTSPVPMERSSSAPPLDRTRSGEMIIEPLLSDSSIPSAAQPSVATSSSSSVGSGSDNNTPTPSTVGASTPTTTGPRPHRTIGGGPAGEPIHLIFPIPRHIPLPRSFPVPRSLGTPRGVPIPRPLATPQNTGFPRPMPTLDNPFGGPASIDMLLQSLASNPTGPRHIHAPRPVLPTPAGPPAAPPAASTVASPVTPPAAPPADGVPATPRPRFPFELLFRPRGPQQQQPAAPAEPAKPFVGQSLESWISERERSLGWRCDAVECQFAPPPEADHDDAEADLNMADIALANPVDKEMLSIYSPTQGPVSVPENLASNPGRSPYVLLACEHRWHRACLETSEKASGRCIGHGDSGGLKKWVKCGRCRKEGWIVPRPGEVIIPLPASRIDDMAIGE